MSKVRQHCARRGFGIGAALKQAGVSRNAFYAQARKDSILPPSLRALAATLGVSAADMLESTADPAARMSELAGTARRIAARQGADAENVRHTLLLLDEKPVDRLRRALRRGRQLNFR